RGRARHHRAGTGGPLARRIRGPRAGVSFRRQPAAAAAVAAHRRHHDRRRARGGAAGTVRHAPAISRHPLLPLTRAAGRLLLPAPDRDAADRAPDDTAAGVATLPRPEANGGSVTGFDGDAPPPPPPPASADAGDAVVADPEAPVANLPGDDPDFALEVPPVAGSEPEGMPPP